VFNTIRIHTTCPITGARYHLTCTWTAGNLDLPSVQHKSQARQYTPSIPRQLRLSARVSPLTVYVCTALIAYRPTIGISREGD
jgi:hypothetical protein